jgi:hypothetical protein
MLSANLRRGNTEGILIAEGGRRNPGRFGIFSQAPKTRRSPAVIQRLAR